MDPQIILGQLLRAKQIKVPVGRMTFTIVRPSEMELVRWRNSRREVEIGLELMQAKVCAWEGVVESDILPGGASDPVSFDMGLWQHWIADRRDLWEPLAAAFAKAIDEHDKLIEGLKGN